MTQHEANEILAEVKSLRNDFADIKRLVLGDGGKSGFIARISMLEEQLNSTNKESASWAQMIHGDGATTGLNPRVNKLEERAHWADQKIDDVDGMVHGDGSNSGLIAGVNTLESRVNFLMFILPILGALLGTLLVAAVIFVSNVLTN